MTDGPPGRAREALLDAKGTAERNPSGANLQALEDARAHMDYLLETLPLPTPDGPGAHTPGPSVSSPLFVVGGEHWPSLEDELLGEGEQ